MLIYLRFLRLAIPKVVIALPKMVSRLLIRPLPVCGKALFAVSVCLAGAAFSAGVFSAGAAFAAVCMFACVRSDLAGLSIALAFCFDVFGTRTLSGSVFGVMLL